MTSDDIKDIDDRIIAAEDAIRLVAKTPVGTAITREQIVALTRTFVSLAVCRRKLSQFTTITRPTFPAGYGDRDPDPSDDNYQSWSRDTELG